MKLQGMGPPGGHLSSLQSRSTITFDPSGEIEVAEP
jgi:hypothetical protein